MSGTFRPVEVPDLGATLARMAQIDATRQQTEIARQQLQQSQAFDAGLMRLAPALASGQGAGYSAALAELAGLGRQGATMALPLLQAERQRAEAADFWRTGGAGTAAPATVPADGALPPGDPNLPRGIRNNNPLNLTYVAGQPGVQGSDGRFGRYGTPEEGIAAATRQLQMYGQRGLTTPAQIIGRWAPPSENNTGAYVAAVAQRAGLDPNQPIDLADPVVVSRLVGAMAHHENGRPLDPAIVQRGVQMGLGVGRGNVTPVAPPASAPPGGVNSAELALLERAMTHPNPQVQQQAQRRLEILRMRQQNNPEQYVTATEMIGGRQVQGQRNTRTGQFTPFPGQTGAEQSGPFGGNGMEAQANNIVLSLAEKIRTGAATPQEQALYQRAYAHLAGGTIQYVLDPSDPTGQRQVAVRVPREMGDLPPPSGGAAPASPTVPTQAGGMTTPAQQAPGSDATPMPTAPGAIPGMERVTPPPAGYRRREDGSMEPIPGGPQDAARQPLTEAQGRSNMFGNAMSQAESILGRVRVPNGAAIAAWRNAPELAVNPLLSSNDQQYFNALRLFAAGVLRKETGAAFTAQELLDVQSRFFPMPGDSAEVLAQKAAARQQTIASMQAEIPGGFRGAAPSPGPGGRGTAEPPPAPPAGFRIVR